MLVIRKEQMKVLSNGMRQRFIDRMVAHLQAVFPDKIMDLQATETESTEDPVRELVGRLIEMASTHDITAERDVARYIDLSMEFGEDFEKDRKLIWAAKILKNKRLSGSARLSLIYEQLPFKAPESRLVQG